MEDGKIIELFFARSEQAIAQVREKYGSLCRMIAGNMLQNAEDVEECINDTLLAVWDAIPPARPQVLRAFVARIARNQARNKLTYNTAQRRSPEMAVSLEELDACLASSADVQQELEDLKQDLEGMKNPTVPTEPFRGTIYVDPGLTRLTEEEFAPIRTELETWCTPYNMALTHIYDSPENVDVYWFLHTSKASTPVTQSDREYLASKGWMHVNELPIQRYTAETIDNALLECFGMTLEQTNKNGLDSFTYWDQTNSYYVRYGGPNYAAIDIQEAVWNWDGTISVFYFNDLCFVDTELNVYEGPMEAKLKPVEGGYRFLSNLPVE